MKVLTIKQPWAYLIASGIKDIENRTWKCPQKYIGERVLIHASAKTLDWDKLINYMTYMGTLDSFTYEWTRKWLTRLQASAIIGSVEIVDCVINHTSIWAEKSQYKISDNNRANCELIENIEVLNNPENIVNPIYNWVLSKPILFDEPILNIKGKLGFWNYEI